eukprot:scaffold108827_cov46-Prasinocladus_malaysianus.AAC.4
MQGGGNAHQLLTLLRAFAIKVEAEMRRRGCGGFVKAREGAAVKLGQPHDGQGGPDGDLLGLGGDWALGDDQSRSRLCHRCGGR